MSQKEMERFADAVRADKGLQEGIKKADTSNEAVLEFAKSRGYDISADEMLNYTQARKDTLTIEDLDKVAGGKGSTSPGIPGWTVTGERKYTGGEEQ